MDQRAVEVGILRQIELARAEEALGSWITYLIRDPRRPDLKGNMTGWPLYVGQTKEFGKRVRNHLRKSERDARDDEGIKIRIKEVLHSGQVPFFEVLDRQPTRLASLVSETNYARLCRLRGYEVANKRKLQNVAGEPITRAEIPEDWLLEFSLDEGLADGIKLDVMCAVCQGGFSCDLEAFYGLPKSPKTLRDIKTDRQFSSEPCVLCGLHGSRTFRFHAS